jgi:hypothetical protein
MQPQPLRSDDFPDGLQTLSERDQARVDSANASYKAMAELLEMLIGWDISVSIENPANSLFWKTSWIERLLKLFPKGHNTILDHCMHGGSRDKTSKFWSYNPLRPDENMLESLALRCDGNHSHKSWKPTVHNGVITYPTKEEAAYPQTLCERLASIFLQWAKIRNLEGPVDLLEQAKLDADIGKRQLFTDQPRSTKLLQPVSEFGRYIALAVPLNCNSVHTLIASLPKGAKPTSRAVHRGFFQGCSLGHLRKSNDHTTRSSSWTRLRGNNGWGAQEPHRVHGSCAEGWAPEGAFGQNFSRCCKSH